VKFSVFIIPVLAFSLSGCYFGRTQIQTTDGRSYQIYGDGELLCEDSQDCKIQQRGTPHTLELEAVKNGQVVGKTTTKREITTASIFWMFCTGYVSLYFYQAYPDDVYIPLDYSNPAVNEKLQNSSGGFAGGDSWSKSPFETGGSSWDNGNGDPTAGEPRAVRQGQVEPVEPAANESQGLQEY